MEIQTTSLNNHKYISLAEASKLTGYNQDYLASLCRSGKLLAKKIDGSWMTTQPSVLNFLDKLKSGEFLENKPKLSLLQEKKQQNSKVLVPVLSGGMIGLALAIAVVAANPNLNSTNLTGFPVAGKFLTRGPEQKTNQGQVLGQTTTTNNIYQTINNTDTKYIDKKITEKFNDLVISGLVNNSQNNTFPSASPNNNPQSTIVYQPVPYSVVPSNQPVTSGTTLFSAGDLSSQRFTTDYATIKNLLTVNGDITLTGTISGADGGIINPGLTEGSVLFQGSLGIAQDNANFYWDDEANLLGVGTSAPKAKIAIIGDSSVGTGTITSSSGVNVTGTGTAFLTELKVGDEIAVNGQRRIVASISTNTALTTTEAFNPVISTTSKVLLVSTATASTEEAPASVSTLTWNHYIDGSIGSRLLIVSVMSSTSTPTVSSVTFGGTSMSLIGSNATSDSRHRLSVYSLLDPPAGLGAVVVTMSTNAVIVGQSTLFANTARPTPITSGTAGGSSGAPDMISFLGSVPTSGVVIASFVTDGSITATLDTSLNAATQLLNTTPTESTTNPRALVGYAYGTGGNTFVYFVGDASNTHRYSISKIVVGTETMGTFTIRKSLGLYTDSQGTNQIKIDASGLANFHSGMVVDLTGDGTTTNVATFNGGNVGIGTTSPSNKLSVSGNADISGSLGLYGGSVDPTIGVNIVLSGALGGGEVTRYGYVADITTTDNASIFGGKFHANSSTSGGLPDHPILEASQAISNFDGSGRVDAAIGAEGNVQNSGSGTINDAYGSFNQLANFSTGLINHAYGSFSDIINVSSNTAITDASLFYGKLRTLGGGTSGYGTAYGLRLTDWSTPGATVTNSYGIYMNNSIDIGTTRYALYSSSTSQSYLQGALGIGDTTPDASLEVVNDGSGDSFLVADTNDGDTTPFVIKSDGKVGIGTTDPAFAKLQISSTTSNIDAIDLTTSSSVNDGFFISLIGKDVYLDQSEDASIIFSTNDEERIRIDPSGNLTVATSDFGDGAAGPVIDLGYNNNGTNTGAGSINFQSKAGTAGYVWQDNAGNMRINTSAPSNANDTAGTVIGTQASVRDAKQDIADYTTYQDALQMVIDAPLHTFRYKNDVAGYGDSSILAKTRIGYIADEVPASFMWGNTIDQVSVNGILMASVKALEDQISQLKTESQNATSNVTIISEQLYLSQDNIGQAKILASQNKVRIIFKDNYQYQPIVTATPLDFTVGTYRITDVDATGFSIELESPQSIDVTFNWHSFASPEAKLTVSDETISDVQIVLPPPPGPTIIDGDTLSSNTSGDASDTPPPVDDGSATPPDAPTEQTPVQG